jgi:hypothetical protein
MLGVGGAADDGDALRRKAKAVAGRAVLGLSPLVLAAACGATGAGPPAPSPGVAAAPLSRPSLPSGAQLVGFGGGDLVGLLGRPTLVRSEDHAQYWRYSLGGCQLDLFLHAEPSDGLARVVHLDVRPSGHVPPSRAAACGDVAHELRGERVVPTVDARAETPELPMVREH